MCIVAAIAGVGVLGAGATVAAGSEAAGATKSATNASISAQQSALTQQQQLNAPYAAIGTGTPGAAGTGGTQGAIGQYQALLGLGPQGAAGEQAALAATPGYQFTQQQGNQGTVNQATAMGLGLSGNTLEGLSQYNTGLADQTYQQDVGNAGQAVTIGQNAAAGTGAAVQNEANNVSSSLVNQGNTLAGIDANTIAGITKSGSNAVNQGITANTLAGLDQFSPTDYATMGGSQLGATMAGPGGYTLNTPGY